MLATAKKMEKSKIGRRFEGKVAIVTSSTQGIGFAITERLGLEGASVVISSRKQRFYQELPYRSITVNNLSGPIPSYLGNISTLIYMSLENNNFYGTVPPELGKLVNLNNLIITINHWGTYIIKSGILSARSQEDLKAAFELLNFWLEVDFEDYCYETHLRN